MIAPVSTISGFLACTGMPVPGKPTSPARINLKASGRCIDTGPYSKLLQDIKQAIATVVCFRPLGSVYVSVSLVPGGVCTASDASRPDRTNTHSNTPLEDSRKPQ